MADESRRGLPGEDGEAGPGQMFLHFMVMEDLIDKLKLLDYEQNFLKSLGFKPLARHYFAIPTNPGEQFFLFTSLCGWLINQAGKKFDMPEEYDDPNATIASIVSEVRAISASADFPPSKLKPGCGEHCIYVIDKLADHALTSTGFKWAKPVYPEEELEEEAAIEDDVEVTLEKVEDEIMEDNDLDEEESFMDLEGLGKLQRRKESQDNSRPEEIMLSDTDANQWKLEVERVAPSLKVHIRTDNKDWRTHVDQMHQHKEGIESALSETKGHLDKLHKEIGRTLEKITSREKYINNQLEHYLQEYRGMQDSLAELKEQYRQASGGVTERTRSLAEISEDLERVKQEMEERGSSMTDGSPLVKIKQALQRLKNEVTQMDVRVGVLQHSLMQAKLRDKTNLQKDMNKAVEEDEGYEYDN